MTWLPRESRCPNGDDDDGTEPTRNTADDGDGGADDGNRWFPRCYCCWQRCRCSDDDDGGDRGDDYCSP